MTATRFGKLRRGSALVTVLMVIAISTLLSSALIGSAFFNLNFSMRVDSAQVAHNLADSAVSLAAAALLQSPAATGSPYVVLGPEPSSSGIVTFNTATSIPYSLDNLGANTTAQSGFDNQAVPPNSIHLIGVGTYKGQVAYSDAIIWVPPYPYVIAASGKIDVNGNLVCGAVKNSSQVTAGGVLPPNSSLLPADMANNTSGSNSIVMTPSGTASVFVAGNVQSQGTVQRNGNVVINGELLEGAQQIPLPKITIGNYDTSLIAGFQTLPNAAPALTAVTGYAYATPNDGMGNYAAQDIHLNGGVVYVNGNLNANTVSGNGAIFVTGTVTVNDNANISTDDTLALVAGGNVNLNGFGAGTSTFKGMVYTEGDFHANNLTVIGSYVANGATSTQGNVFLQNANVMYAPDKASPTNFPSATSTGSAVWSSPGIPFVQLQPPGSPGVNVTVSPTVSFDGTNYVLSLRATNSPAISVTATWTTAIPAPTMTLTWFPTLPHMRMVYSYAPVTPSPWINAFAQISANYGWGPSAVATQANTAINTAYTSSHWATLPPLPPSGGGGTGIPVALTPSPFTFDTFLTNPANAARVLMWQHYLVSPSP